MGNLKFSIFFTLIVVFALKAKGWDLVKKEQRRSIVETEYGEISAVDVDDGSRNYHLQFFTLDPNAIFLPVLLHADMVLHVKTGSGRLYWTPGDEETTIVSLQKGDIYRVPPGSIFFLKSDLQPEREKLRIHAIFASSDDDIQFSSIGAYSSVTDMVRGFDKNILQAAFKAPEEVIEALLNSTVSSIVHSETTDEKKLVQLWDWEISFLRALGGGRAYRSGDSGSENKKKKQKGGRTFNVFKEKADFENCNGWSLTVTKSDLHSLKQSNFGVFYVNLTKGSMMGPHWNPQASEIAMVVEGQGMVRVVCANNQSSECKSTSFRVKEGDVFVVPRFHPMAQMSFNNDSLVFIGFTTSTKRNYPQFLAGKASVLQVLDKNILATAFQVSNSTITDLLAPQEESVILECTSCAEDEEVKVEEEIEKKREREREKEEKQRREEEAEREREEEEKERREEEKRRKEEEEARKREEEEAEKERQEEEKRKREEEEEEARKREEEEREREEEAHKREEEKAEREREEEEARKREEEEARKREEEEARKREEEEARKREEEEARKREEEEARKREEEERQREAEKEEEEKEKGEETEEEAARREEEERIRREEEEEEKRKKIERMEEGEPRRVLRKIWKV